MDQSEVEKLIGDLETALDRLRSLYEQYFMGIERIEPGVVRKDVDRRFYVLRKEQIRNTALRYRFQMLLQKYNTYQTHWQRVCREIENGTYKRHLMRAQRRFGSSRPPRRRWSVAPAEVLPPPGAALPQALAAELAELDRDLEPTSVDVEIRMDDEPSSPPPSHPLPRPPTGPAMPPVAGLSSPALGAAAAPGPLSPRGASAWKKVGAGRPVPAPTQAGAVAQREPVAPPQAAPRPAPLAQPLPGMPPSGSPPVRPGVPRPPLTGGSPAAPPPARPAPPAAPPGPKHAAQPPHPRPESPQPANRPVQAGAHVAPPQRPQPPRPTPSAPPPNVPGLPRPQWSPPAAAPAAGELSDKRLRQIYVDYVDAKRRQNESTATITFQSVAKSLRESQDRLRQKHGKEVDFEVAVKDGKTILRPVLK